MANCWYDTEILELRVSKVTQFTMFSKYHFYRFAYIYLIEDNTIICPV